MTPQISQEFAERVIRDDAFMGAIKDFLESADEHFQNYPQAELLRTPNGDSLIENLNRARPAMRSLLRLSTSA